MQWSVLEYLKREKGTICVREFDVVILFDVQFYVNFIIIFCFTVKEKSLHTLMYVGFVGYVQWSM